MDSILTFIKSMLGIDKDYTHFDSDIIMNINSSFSSLNQLGVGPSTGFLITDESKTWNDFIGSRDDLESIKMYTYLKARLGFDPPTNAFLVEAMERQIHELEWRINSQVEGEV